MGGRESTHLKADTRFANIGNPFLDGLYSEIAQEAIYVGTKEAENGQGGLQESDEF
jgi:hypothetical protein